MSVYIWAYHRKWKRARALTYWGELLARRFDEEMRRFDEAVARSGCFPESFDTRRR